MKTRAKTVQRSLHSADVVQSIKRTGLDNLNVVVFQVTVEIEKATLRLIYKKYGLHVVLKIT